MDRVAGLEADDRVPSPLTNEGPGLDRIEVIFGELHFRGSPDEGDLAAQEPLAFLEQPLDAGMGAIGGLENAPRDLIALAGKPFA
jgi:hypothetical protein